MKKKDKEAKARAAEKKQDPKLSRREMLEKSGRYSVAVVSLIFGGGAIVELLGCDKGSNEPICYDTCYYARDLECDDGGSGSVSAECDFGTDCTDCGTRYGYDDLYGDYSNSYGDYYNYYDDYVNSYYNYADVYYNYYDNYGAFGGNG